MFVFSETTNINVEKKVACLIYCSYYLKTSTALTAPCQDPDRFVKYFLQFNFDANLEKCKQNANQYVQITDQLI